MHPSWLPPEKGCSKVNGPRCGLDAAMPAAVAMTCLFGSTLKKRPDKTSGIPILRPRNEVVQCRTKHSGVTCRLHVSPLRAMSHQNVYIACESSSDLHVAWRMDVRLHVVWHRRRHPLIASMASLQTARRMASASDLAQVCHRETIRQHREFFAAVAKRHMQCFHESSDASGQRATTDGSPADPIGSPAPNLT